THAALGSLPTLIGRGAGRDPALVGGRALTARRLVQCCEVSLHVARQREVRRLPRAAAKPHEQRVRCVELRAQVAISLRSNVQQRPESLASVGAVGASKLGELFAEPLAVVARAHAATLRAGASTSSRPPSIVMRASASSATSGLWLTNKILSAPICSAARRSIRT